jgi:folate-binding protein YgfZ
MISNDVAALVPGESCDALLLTPKARVIAPLRVTRRAADDFLLSTEPELGDVLRTQLLRARFAANAEIEPEQHEAWLVLDGHEVVDEQPPGEQLDDQAYERWRIEAGIPSWGREIDDRVLPAEAGLTETHVSFTKGCYPGQEPIARQHHRGKLNRRLRILDVEGEVAADDEIEYKGRKVGRITSAVPGVALGYVRTEVPERAILRVGRATARMRQQ